MDTESLLVDWLSELAYWAEIEMLIFHEFKIESVSPTHLRGKNIRHRVTQLEKHIKAVTYHNLDSSNKQMTEVRNSKQIK